VLSARSTRAESSVPIQNHLPPTFVPLAVGQGKHHSARAPRNAFESNTFDERDVRWCCRIGVGGVIFGCRVRMSPQAGQVKVFEQRGHDQLAEDIVEVLAGGAGDENRRHADRYVRRIQVRISCNPVSYAGKLVGNLLDHLVGDVVAGCLTARSWTTATRSGR